MTRRRLTALAGAALLALGLAACTGGSTHRPASAPTSVSTATPIQVGGAAPMPAGAERSYGPSVGSIPGAVYQPDVVVIGGGADAIVSAQDNGLVWTLRAGAPGVDRLAVGRVMVATALSTGRVVALTRAAGTVQVVLAPVALTDVFQRLDVTSTSPVTLQQPLAYTYAGSPLATTDDGTAAPAAPATTTPSAPPTAPPVPKFAAGPVLRAAAPSVPPTAPSGVTLPQPDISPKPVHEGKFDLTPFCCFPSQGVHIAYNDPAGRMAATVGLVMNGKPYVDFHIDIDATGLREAVFQLNGPDAIEFRFDAATTDVSGNYRSPTFAIPVGFSFPVLGIPFTVTLTQSVRASIQLAGQAAFSTVGKYTIHSGLGFAYRNGKFGATTPSFSTSLSALQNATSLSVGINALSITYGARFAIGIGVIGFNGGPFAELTATLAIDKDGSPPQTSLTAGCAVAAVYVGVSYGVGYTIPEFVAKTVNTFLSLFGAKPIKAKGGFTKGPFTLWNPGPGKQCLHR